MPKTKERIVFLDLLKTVCLFGVILGHLATWQIGERQPGMADWNVSHIYNTLCRVCVPVFLMVSGYLALDENHGRRALAHPLAQPARFGALYLVWAVLYTLPDLPGLVTRPADLLAAVAKGPFHLWYLVMLAGVYLVLPLLYRISRSDRELDYALALCFVSTMVLPSLAGLPGLAWLQQLLDKWYLDTGFVFYVLAGYRLRCRPLGPAARRLLYIAGILATLWEGVVTWQLSCRAGSLQDFWLDQRSLTVALGALALFVFFQQQGDRVPAGLARGAAFFARGSLGVYAVHLFFLLALRKFGVSVYALPPVWWLPLLAVLVLLASRAVTAVLAQLPLLRRLV